MFSNFSSCDSFDEDSKANVKPKRVFFSDTDTQLLVKCIEAHSDVINKNKTDGITPRMKWQVNKCLFST